MIYMVGCAAGSNVLVSLDDSSVWTDEGTAYEAFAITNPLNFGKTSPQGRLRRINVAVTIGGDADVTLTPWGDGDEFEDQAVTESLLVSAGSTQIVEAEPAVDGQRFQFRMAAENFGGPVAFGESDVDLIEKRSA